MKFRNFRYLVVEGLKNIWTNRLMSIASVGVLVACMLLMGAAVLLSVNVERVLSTLQDQNVVMVYTADDTSEADAMIAMQQIQQLSNVQSVDFVSKEEGVESLIQDMGEEYADLFEFVDEGGEKGSFLPYGIRVSFVDLAQYDQTIEQIRAVEHVDHINDSRELTMQIINMRNLVTTAGVCIVGLLFITALVIIANTIKITMHNRKLDISIMTAEGATNNFIRLPFVIEGIVLGIIAAALTTGLLYGVYRLVVAQLQRVMSLQAVPFGSVVWWLFGLFCLMGVVTGCIGSVISIGKYLRKEGSEFRAF